MLNPEVSRFLPPNSWKKYENGSNVFDITNSRQFNQLNEVIESVYNYFQCDNDVSQTCNPAIERLSDHPDYLFYLKLFEFNLMAGDSGPLSYQMRSAIANLVRFNSNLQ